MTIQYIKRIISRNGYRFQKIIADDAGVARSGYVPE